MRFGNCPKCKEYKYLTDIGICPSCEEDGEADLDDLLERASLDIEELVEKLSDESSES